VADNVAVTAGSGTTIATDDIGGAHYQRMKVSWGVDGSAVDASATNPLPITHYDPDIVSGPTSITATDAVVAAPAGAGATVSGASTAGSHVFVLCPGGDSAWNVQLTGVSTGSFHFEGSMDSTNGTDGTWINVNGRQTGIVNTVLAGTVTTNGIYRGNTSGLKYFRVRQTGTYTGTPVVTIRISGGIGAVFLNASIPTGSNNIGLTGRAGPFPIRVDSAGLTIATTAYTAGDQMGTIFTLPNAATATAGGGYIKGVSVVSAADITGAMDVVFFRQSVTLAGDNAAFAISDADAKLIIDIVQMGTSVDIGNNRIARATGLEIPYDVTATSMFASLITRVGHTFFAAVTDLQLTVYVERG